MMTTSGDFNGDGLDDLAIGIPGKNVGAAIDAGQVSVIYGTVNAGLATPRNQLWDLNRPGVRGNARTDDAFGSALATGDFDGDGFMDLAIGAPGKKVGTLDGAGAVTILYGTVDGLTGTGSELWTADEIPVGDGSQEDSAFGSAVTAGDFNGDGFDDLVIGSPFQTRGSSKNVGAAYVLYGTSGGLTTSGAQIWSLKSTGIVGAPQFRAEFAASLTAGDFDSDGFEDLAIGAPNNAGIGTTNVLYGTAVRLRTPGNQQFFYGGSAVATGDFNGDFYADLAVGAASNSRARGSVSVVYGSEDGLPPSVRDVFTQRSFDVSSTRGDSFGFSLVSGDFDGDLYDDLAIGAPLAEANGIDRAGLVRVIYGSDEGLTISGAQRLDQGPGVDNVSEEDDLFGFSLAAGDYNGDGYFDLSIGVPGEDWVSLIDSGIVHVIYGWDEGIDTSNQQLWRLGLPGLLGHANSFDTFGWALA